MNRTTRLILWLAGWAVCLVAVLCIVLVVLVHHSRGQLAAAKDALAARGEVLDPMKLAPPPSPTINNGADAFLAAAAEIRSRLNKDEPRLPNMGREVSPGKKQIIHLQTAAPSSSGTSVSWADLDATWASLDAPLAQIRRAVRTENFDAQPDFSKGFDMQIPGLSESLIAARTLAGTALSALHDGDITRATDDIEATLLSARLNGAQPVLLGQLVLANILFTAQNPTWEILQAHAVDETSLARLQSAWSTMNPASAVAAVLRMERATVLPLFGTVDEAVATASSTPGGTTSTYGADELAGMVRMAIWRTAFRHSDERLYLMEIQDLLDHIPSDPAAGPWMDFLALSEKQTTALNATGLPRLFSQMIVVNVRSAVTRIVTAQAVRNLTVTALALRRYQLANGRLPDGLNALVPAFLPKVPDDPFVGQPLHYRIEGGTNFLLYSVGPDGTDNQGDPTPTGKRPGLTNGRDIVWPQPAP